ncbi:SRPBCC family protein [Nocardia sp. NPDC050793]|uniref:SRPBCC family protein n=1 Tax=Nocardia sp. NPDC050793 TaxID=3155159 RepID=UPI003401E927
MPTYTVEMQSADEPAELFAALRAYRSARDAAAQISRDTADSTSHWIVPFRNGRLEWRQQESHPAESSDMLVSFHQVEGPFAQFAGSWSVAPDAGGALFHYQLDFRTSVPNWAGAIDRVIGRAVLQAVVDSVSVASTGTATLTEGAALLTDIRSI